MFFFLPSGRATMPFQTRATTCAIYCERGKKEDVKRERGEMEGNSKASSVLFCSAQTFPLRPSRHSPKKSSVSHRSESDCHVVFWLNVGSLPLRRAPGWMCGWEQGECEPWRGLEVRTCSCWLKRATLILHKHC